MRVAFNVTHHDCRRLFETCRLFEPKKTGALVDLVTRAALTTGLTWIEVEDGKDPIDG